jgi:hypothetical protein
VAVRGGLGKHDRQYKVINGVEYPMAQARERGGTVDVGWDESGSFSAAVKRLREEFHAMQLSLRRRIVWC